MDFQILRGDLDPRSTTATSVRGDAAPFQREQCGLLLRCCRRVAGTTSHTGTGVPPESRSRSVVFPLGGRLPNARAPPGPPPHRNAPRSSPCPGSGLWSTPVAPGGRLVARPVRRQRHNSVRSAPFPWMNNDWQKEGSCLTLDGSIRIRRSRLWDGGGWCLASWMVAGLWRRPRNGSRSTRRRCVSGGTGSWLKAIPAC